MQISGTFGRFLRRNEQTGESTFSVKTDTGHDMLFHAVTIPYRYSIPLLVETENKIYATDGKKTVITADYVSAFGFSAEASAEYISGKTFHGIGPDTAKNILDRTGNDIFSYVRSHNGRPDFHAAKVQDKDLAALFSAIYWYVQYEDTVKFITDLGGTFSIAKGLYSVKGRYAIEDAAKNPYCMAEFGANIALCDRLASEKNFTPGDPHRIKAITQIAMQRSLLNGNSVIPFERLLNDVHKLEDDGGYYHTDRVYIGAEVLSDRYRVEVKNNTLWVSGAAEYTAEHRIADHIRRLLWYSAPRPNDPVPEDNIEYSEGQKKAFDLLSSTGLKVVTGGPGTGKTTVLNGLLKQYKHNNPGADIALCAPTGCAARRMTEATGMEALTVHKLLGIKPYEDIHDPAPSLLDADLIICDESSMLDIYVAARLLSAVKDTATLILVGDADQLPSVAPGAVFRDIIDSKAVPVVYLTDVFRQDKRSDIIWNSRCVLNGKPSNEIKTGGTFVIRRYNDIHTLHEAVVKAARKRKDDFRLFSPVKKSRYECGTIALNNDLRLHTRDSLSYGEYTFSIGDKVIFNKNDYDKGYYNGEAGIITNTQRVGERIVVNVKTEDGDLTLENEEIGALELAYALTAHKSQGSECETALIVIPKEPKSMLKRQLLYVEITRARKNVALFVEGDALERLLGNSGQIKRNTTLKDLLMQTEKTH